MIKIEHHGDLDKTVGWLKRLKQNRMFKNLDKFGVRGVQALEEATPKDTGITATSWSYKIEQNGREVKIIYCNSNVIDEWCNVAIIIQYGHATKNGGYVEGIDYINPALAPVFQKIADEVWEEVERR
ncbi:MAG: HK97 gp10 family phage protein [Pseudobutyrivibrio sp.]|nr:HK97 gp10 family phage protein [Pseudobutyrivibrio sp.]